MKKLFKTLGCLVAAAAALTACNNDDDNVTINYFDFTTTPYAYFLCEGTWGQNNASISYLIADQDNNAQIKPDLYLNANGKALGDQANDLLLMNNRLYVVVSGSRYIAKLDDHGKEIVRHEFSEEDGNPRHMISIDGDLYATLYGGTLVRMDTATLAIKQCYTVGSMPEELTLIGDRVVVCNTGYGSGTSLSLVDVATGDVKEIETAVNPTEITRIGNGLAGLFKTTSYDAQWNATNTIWLLNAANGWSIDSLTTASHILPLTTDNVLLLDQQVDYSAIPATYHNTFRQYNLMTGYVANVETPFTIDLSTAPIYMLSQDWRNGDLYIATSESDETGAVLNSKLYLFNGEGKHLNTFEDAGGVFMSKGVYHDLIQYVE